MIKSKNFLFFSWLINQGPWTTCLIWFVANLIFLLVLFQPITPSCGLLSWIENCFTVPPLNFSFKLFCSGSSAGHSLKEAGIFWSLLMILSFLFQAADTVLKVSISECLIINWVICYESTLVFIFVALKYLNFFCC